jgi:hypothetical protein
MSDSIGAKLDALQAWINSIPGGFEPLHTGDSPTDIALQVAREIVALQGIAEDIRFERDYARATAERLRAEVARIGKSGPMTYVESDIFYWDGADPDNATMEGDSAEGAAIELAELHDKGLDRKHPAEFRVVRLGRAAALPTIFAAVRRREIAGEIRYAATIHDSIEGAEAALREAAK